MAYAAKVLKDSISPDGIRLTTMEVTFPRIVLAEFNTHRMLSRNSASSRAIPVEKRIASLELDSFEPEAFGKNQKGMQASEDLRSEDDVMARAEWTLAKVDAIRHAQKLALLGVHKQLANRLIEPFCWHTVICSATEWDNYYALRCHPDAQPEIRRVSEMMRAVQEASEPSPVNFGDWHLPLVDASEAFDLLAGGMSISDLCKVSIGRCARVSYLTHDGRRDPLADVELANRLQSSGHMSPFEHVARPITRDDIEDRGLTSWRPFVGNFCGWVQFRKTVANEDNFKRVLESHGR